MKARIEREMAAEAADRERNDSRFSNSSRAITNGSNGGSYSNSRAITNGSHGGSHGGSSHGGSGSHSHSRSSRSGASHFSRGPSALSRGASTHGDSRDSSSASRSVRRIADGQSNAGQSSHASNGGSISRDVARRF